MKTWLCAVAVVGTLLGGCAKDEAPTAIDGKVDIVPAKTDQAAATTDAAVPDAATVPDALTTDDGAEAGAPKGKDKKGCAASVKASNDLLDKDVIALFEKKALKNVEHLAPADTFNCDKREGPDFGGVAALWNQITGAKAIELFEADGWTREDPADGAPDWATKGLKHGDGSMNLEPAEKYIVTFHLSRGGREFWAELTQDGMRAGFDDAA